jgi:hypothetical protein
MCGVAEWEMRAWWGRRGWGTKWGREGVVGRTWSSDEKEMDGWEGIRFFFHRVGRSRLSITVKSKENLKRR